MTSEENINPVLTLDGLASMGETPLPLVGIEAVDTTSGRKYKLRFFDVGETTPRYVVDSEKKSDFLRKGTIEEAKDDLLQFAIKARNKTGGKFAIDSENNPIKESQAVDEMDKRYHITTFLGDHPEFRLDNGVNREPMEVTAQNVANLMTSLSRDGIQTTRITLGLT